jgi:hypothetical protein
MAIIRDGRILLEAEPQAAVQALRGQVWRREVPRDELKAFEAAHPVISTTLVGGRTVVHVHGDTPPDDSFQPVEPDLKDVYFTAMRGIGISRRVEAPVDVPADRAEGERGDAAGQVTRVDGGAGEPEDSGAAAPMTPVDLETREPAVDARPQVADEATAPATAENLATPAPHADPFAAFRRSPAAEVAANERPVEAADEGTALAAGENPATPAPEGDPWAGFRRPGTQ